MSSQTMELQQRDDITEILKYVLFSDYVILDQSQKEFALSVLVVAPVGEGKTSITDQYSNNSGILEVTKVTENALLHEYMTQLQSGVRLYYPDMVNTGNMKEDTVNALMCFLKDYINWDGVKSISYFNTHIPMVKPLKGSLMGTMASRDFLRMSRNLASSGFLSRVLLVGYHYKREKIIEIMDDYAYKRGRWDKIDLSLPDRKCEVATTPARVKALIPMALKMATKIEGYHIRALQQMTLMSKSRALSEGRLEVDDGDIDRVKWLYGNYACKVPGLDKEVTDIMRTAWQAEQAESKGSAK